MLFSCYHPSPVARKSESRLLPNPLAAPPLLLLPQLWKFPDKLAAFVSRVQKQALHASARCSHAVSPRLENMHPPRSILVSVFQLVNCPAARFVLESTYAAARCTLANNDWGGASGRTKAWKTAISMLYCRSRSFPCFSFRWLFGAGFARPRIKGSNQRATSSFETALKRNQREMLLLFMFSISTPPLR